MWILWGSLWMETAKASAFFVSISEPQLSGIGATWSFPVVGEDGWFLASGQGGDLTFAPMDDFGNVDMSQVQTLTDMGTIKDHALRVCPDGGYLYAASTGVEEDNLVYWWSSDFELLGFDVIPQGNPPHAGNDMAAVCTDNFMGVGVAEQNGLRDFFWDARSTGVADGPIELAESPRMTGAGMWEHRDLLYVVGRDARPELSVSMYNDQLQLVDTALIPPAQAGVVHYWPTAVLEVGSYFVMVSMGRDPGDGWPLDTGNVYLAVLDLELHLLEWIALSDHIPEEGGGMRPWMARKENQIWVSYDRGNQVHLVSLVLDPVAFALTEPSEEPSEEPTDEPGDEPGDEPTTEPSEEPGVHSGEETEIRIEKEGCAGVLWLPLGLYGRRKFKSRIKY